MALFFREVHPASEMGYKHRQNRLFPDVGDLAPKARKTFFTKVRSQRAHFFVYRRPQGIYADLTSKLQREQTTGTPPFCFPSVVSPIWQIVGKKMCLNSTFFRYSARSPHRATKPSRGWLRVVVRKLRLVLVELDRAGNKVTARARAYCRGCCCRPPASGFFKWEFPMGSLFAVLLFQRREQRSGLRPFVLFSPVEIGWSASWFWDRTAEWPH